MAKKKTTTKKKAKKAKSKAERRTRTKTKSAKKRTPAEPPAPAETPKEPDTVLDSVSPVQVVQPMPSLEYASEIGDYCVGLVCLGDGTGRRRFKLGYEDEGIEVWQIIGGDPNETITVFKKRGRIASMLIDIQIGSMYWPVAMDRDVTPQDKESLQRVLGYWALQRGLR